MQTFPVVLLDPPWEYASRCTWSDTRFGGGVSDHYQTSDSDDLQALAPQFHAMKPESGVMMMWAVSTHMHTAIALMESYGYTYRKIIFVWAKEYERGGVFYGPGAYTGSNAEYVLLGQADMNAIFTPKSAGGTKGVNELFFGPDAATILAPHPRNAAGKIIHSRKPAVFRQRIEQLFGEHPRVEAFARERVPGWHALGDQIPGGQLMVPGKVIEPLPPVSPYEAAVQHHGRYQQAPLLLREGA